MMLDAQLVLTYTSAALPETQVFGDAAATPTYRQLDLGAGQTYANGSDGSGPVQALGNGQPVYLIALVSAKSAEGTSPSLDVKLCAATDTDFTSSRVIASTGAIATALIPAGTLIVLPVPPSLSYRFWRGEVALNNNDNEFTLKMFLSGVVPTPLMQLGPAYLA
jgi:hypothetical protein